MTTRFDELAAAMRALAQASEEEIALVREMVAPCAWPERTSDAPLLPCGIRHGVPWGVSVAPGEHRVLIEAQSETPTARAYWEAGRRVTEWIRRQPGADTSRLEAIEAAFAPEDARAAFRVWHMAAFRAGGPPRFKIYLCPGARGQAHVQDSLRTALPSAAPLPLRREDRVTIVSLDLTADAPLVKQYVLMPDATPADVARLHDLAEEAVPGDPQRFAEGMLDAPARPLWWLVALGYPDRAAAPRTAAVHLGIPRHVPDAETARRRAAALARRPVQADLHFVSFQRRAGEERTTLYFMPQVSR